MGERGRRIARKKIGFQCLILYWNRSMYVLMCVRLCNFFPFLLLLWVRSISILHTINVIRSLAMSKWIFIEFLDFLQSKWMIQNLCVRSARRHTHIQQEKIVYILLFHTLIHVFVCGGRISAEILNFNFYLMDSLVFGSFFFISSSTEWTNQTRKTWPFNW